MRSDLFAAFLGSAIVCVAPAAAASPTTFTYQGHLAQDGTPAEGAYEFEIRLLDNLGVQIGMTQTASEVVTAGAFSMQLDFGNAAFDGSERYLEISVRSVADGGAYTALSPNQLVTSAPVAQFALSGNEGPQGAQGDDGSEGPQGNPGADGDDGAPGDQGLQGDQGIQGLQGIQGDSGTDGAQGTPGDSHWVLNGLRTHYLNGNVGIGTANPSSRLHVETETTSTAITGQSAGTSGTGVLGFASSSSGITHGVWGQVESNDGYAGYFIGGKNYFEGKVGIGIDDPSFPLHVVSSDVRAVFAQTSYSAGSGVFGLASSSSGLNVGVVGSSLSTSGTGVYGLAGASSGTNYGVSGESESVIGRGVYGHASANSGSNYGVYGRTDSVEGTGVFGYASSSATGSNSAAIHGLVDSDTAYAGYFDGGKNYFGGRVGLRTTFPSDQLHINAPAGENAFRVQADGQTRIRVNANGGVSLGGNSTIVEAGNTVMFGSLGIGDSTPEEKLDVVGNAVISGRLTVGSTTPQTSFDLAVAGSAAKTGGGSWAVFSDQRLKKNITSMTGSLDTISALRPVNFEYTAKDHFSYTLGVQSGFIAQEVAKVIPQWVNTADDGFFYLDQVGYEALIVDAIQELRAEKDAEIKQLRDRLDRLERMMALSVDR